MTNANDKNNVNVNIDALIDNVTRENDMQNARRASIKNANDKTIDEFITSKINACDHVMKTTTNERARNEHAMKRAMFVKMREMRAKNATYNDVVAFDKIARRAIRVELRKRYAKNA